MGFGYLSEAVAGKFRTDHLPDDADNIHRTVALAVTVLLVLMLVLACILHKVHRWVLSDSIRCKGP